MPKTIFTIESNENLVEPQKLGRRFSQIETDQKELEVTFILICVYLRKSAADFLWLNC